MLWKSCAGYCGDVVGAEGYPTAESKIAAGTICQAFSFRAVTFFFLLQGMLSEQNSKKDENCMGEEGERW